MLGFGKKKNRNKMHLGQENTNTIVVSFPNFFYRGLCAAPSFEVTRTRQRPRSLEHGVVIETNRVFIRRAKIEGREWIKAYHLFQADLDKANKE